MKKVIEKLTELMQITQFDIDLTKNPEENHEKLSKLIERSLEEIPTKKNKNKQNDLFEKPTPHSWLLCISSGAKREVENQKQYFFGGS